MFTAFAYNRKLCNSISCFLFSFLSSVFEWTSKSLSHSILHEAVTLLKVINAFHNVNIVLFMVTSVRTIWKRWRKMENDRRFKRSKEVYFKPVIQCSQNFTVNLCVWNVMFISLVFQPFHIFFVVKVILLRKSSNFVPLCLTLMPYMVLAFNKSNKFCGVQAAKIKKQKMARIKFRWRWPLIFAHVSNALLVF